MTLFTLQPPFAQSGFFDPRDNSPINDDDEKLIVLDPCDLHGPSDPSPRRPLAQFIRERFNLARHRLRINLDNGFEGKFGFVFRSRERADGDESWFEFRAEGTRL